MSTLYQLVPLCLYLVVGIISFMMASKNLLAERFLPFHEAASGKRWEELDKRLQDVLLALMKISGMGFLVTGLLLTVCPVVNYFYQDTILKIAAPMAALVFCMGLFFINYTLHRRTNGNTPWKKSLYASCLIGAGIVITLLQ